MRRRTAGAVTLKHHQPEALELDPLPGADFLLKYRPQVLRGGAVARPEM
jgi:hypothetical protein